jgi:hypothetical protein
MERTSEPRRFTLLDAMVLLAAAAIGLALWRHHLEHMWIDVIRSWPPQNIEWYWYNSARSVNVLVPWSVALLALSLRQPRPRRLISRASATVGIVVSAGLTMWAILFLLVVCVKGSSPVRSLGGVWFRIGLLMPTQVALSLASVWLLVGTSSDERRLDWLEVLGWLLGGCWVLLGLLCPALYLLADF